MQTKNDQAIGSIVPIPLYKYYSTYALKLCSLSHSLSLFHPHLSHLKPNSVSGMLTHTLIKPTYSYLCTVILGHAEPQMVGNAEK